MQSTMTNVGIGIQTDSHRGLLVVKARHLIMIDVYIIPMILLHVLSTCALQSATSLSCSLSCKAEDTN